MYLVILIKANQYHSIRHFVSVTGMLLVAVSRVRRFRDLLLLDLNPDHIPPPCAVSQEFIARQSAVPKDDLSCCRAVPSEDNVDFFEFVSIFSTLFPRKA